MGCDWLGGKGCRRREGCSLHLPGQPPLFPAGLAGDGGFLSVRFCCYFRSSRLGVWTRWCPGLTSSSPYQLWLGRFLGFLNICDPEYAKAVYSRGGEDSWKKLELPESRGLGAMWGGALGLHPKSGQVLTYSSPNILQESPSPCL